MNLDAARRRRQIVREAQLARATALSNATAQGAQAGSGLQGGFAQVTSQQNDAILGVNQNQELGSEIFSANRQLADARTQSNIGSSISSIGGQIMQNRGAISRVGQYAFG